jgi:3-phenylpropionate/trans-cinnamate dioxygenase ferredoxin subunit
MQKNFIIVARVEQIRPGATKQVTVNGHDILIANVDGTFYAVDDLCTHEDSSLSLGCLKGELVDCTLHGSQFNVVTGEPVEEPATEALRTWPVRLEGSDILVGVGG